MSTPSARVGRNRRRAYIYCPLLAVGALAVLTSSPIFNGVDLFGVIALAAGAAGFVFETGKTMTEQPVETEQQFLGNVPTPPRQVREAYLRNGHRIPPKLPALVQIDVNESARDGIYALGLEAPIRVDEAEEAPVEGGRTDLLLEAEVHAGHAVRSLENGGLDAGIAWLQSALAFALNARHGRDFTSPEHGAL